MFAARCTQHPRLTEVTSAHLMSRVYTLETWPLSLRSALDADPRCGCAEDGAGAVCQWDSLDALANELGSRGL